VLLPEILSTALPVNIGHLESQAQLPETPQRSPFVPPTIHVVSSTPKLKSPTPEQTFSVQKTLNLFPSTMPVTPSMLSPSLLSKLAVNAPAMPPENPSEPFVLEEDINQKMQVLHDQGILIRRYLTSIAWLQKFSGMGEAIKGFGVNFFRTAERAIPAIKDAESVHDNTIPCTPANVVVVQDKTQRQLDLSGAFMGIWKMFRRNNLTVKSFEKHSWLDAFQYQNSILLHKHILPVPAVHVPFPAVHVPVPAVHVPVPGVHVPVPAVHVNPVPGVHVPVPAVYMLSPAMHPSPPVNLAKKAQSANIDSLVAEFFKIYNGITIGVVQQWHNQIRCHRDYAASWFETVVSALCIELLDDLAIFDVWEVLLCFIINKEGAELPRRDNCAQTE